MSLAKRASVRIASHFGSTLRKLKRTSTVLISPLQCSKDFISLPEAKMNDGEIERRDVALIGSGIRLIEDLCRSQLIAF